MTEKLTIIVPIYNVGKYLNDCFESLFNQTRSDFKVYMINDGSTDSSEELCRLWCDKDRRFEYIYQENAGLGPARMTGIRLANTEWISFLDADDWIDCDYVEKMMSMAEQSDADVIYCDHWNEKKDNCIYSSSRSFANWYGLSNNDKIELADNCSMCAAIYKRNLWVDSGIEMPGILYEDSAVYPFVLNFAKKIVNINEALYHYRNEREGSLMDVGRKDYRNMIKAMETLWKQKDNFAWWNKQDDYILKNFIFRKMSMEWNRVKKNLEFKEKKNCQFHITNLLKTIDENWEEETDNQMFAIGSYIPTQVYNRSVVFRDERLSIVFSSFIGLMTNEKYNYDVSFKGNNKYRISMIKKQLSGEWKTHIKDCQYVVFDLMEEINDIVEYKNMYLSKSEAFDEVVKWENDMRLIKRDTNECWNLWKKNITDILNYLVNEEKSIIMLENYLAEEYGHPNNFYPYDDIGYIKKCNELLEKYYNYVKECFSQIMVITIPKNYFKTDDSFPYGCEPYYYNNAVIYLIEQLLSNAIE